MSYFTEIKIIDPITGEAVNINDSGQMHVVLRGLVDSNNSSSTPLDAGATFTGETTDVLDYAVIFVSVYADVASATDGLELQQSCDGTHWDVVDKYTIPAGKGKIFSVPPGCEYFRVVYTNGGSAQTEFRISTVLKKTNSRPNSHRLSDNIVEDDDAELHISVIKGQNPAGDYVDFDATTLGNFKMSLEELENLISVNGNSQLKITRFDSSGNEAPLASSSDPNHNKVVGVDYVPGNSGVDASTETLQVLTYEHHEIHSGSHFGLSGYELDVPSGDVIDFAITTPDTTTFAHMVFTFGASEGATMEIYEGATGISGGTAITPINNNRNSTNTSVLTVLRDPTITSDGTYLTGYLASGERESGKRKRDRELMLRRNTTYIFRITSLGAANDLFWEGTWYEHADKN